MRIAIANDMPVAVEALRRTLARGDPHELAWVARDGREAVTLCARDTPDLLLMDLEMPEMGGVEATRRIMAATPCAILVVTGDVGARASQVFEAMGAGALDAVDTPSLGYSGDGAHALLRKVAAIRALLHDRDARRSPPAAGPAAPHQGTRSLVAIGASAGGPAALATLLGGLPPGFGAAIVIVQHVDAHFAPGMAHWLARQCRLPVRLCGEGELPRPGLVLMASGNDHLQLRPDGRLGYCEVPLGELYRPSVDVLFQSICRAWPGQAIGVLLTGMGRDGALGLRCMREQGHHTIVQDQASSAVFGMPKAALALDAACAVLPIQQIAAALCQQLASNWPAVGRPLVEDNHEHPC